MSLPFPPRTVAALIICTVLLRPPTLRSDPVKVRHTEGVVHGFLVLRTLDGQTLATGDVTQSPRAGRITSHLVFHFRDGSIHDETAVYSQRGSYRLLKYHLLQKGPAFPHRQNFSFDSVSGQVTVRYAEKDGQEKVEQERMELPADLANGIVLTLLKNIGPEQLPATVSMLAATPKPRLVQLKITNGGKDKFSVGGLTREATHYVIKIEIGGVKGIVAPLVGKQPPDEHVWIIGGEAPGFVKSEGILFQGGPIWRIELTNPVWPKSK